MIKAVLFDYDGTIMDTEPAIIASYEELFRRYRTVEDFTPERRVEVLGPALSVMMEKFFPEKDPEQMVGEYRLYQREKAIQLIQPLPHAMEMLAWLKEHHIPCGLVSTRYSDSMKNHLNRLEMNNVFDTIIGHDNVTKEKPDPEGILKSCELLNVDPSSDTIIYVGDSKTDVLAGKAAGAITVALVSNENKRGQLIESAPDYLIDDLYDLIAIFEAHI